MSKSLKKGAGYFGPALILIIWFLLSDVIDNKLITCARQRFPKLLTPTANLIGLGSW